jgi:hypothetical protein
MRNLVDIDHRHSRAICDGIGERLQSHLGAESELPVGLRMQVEQLHRSEAQTPSIVPDMPSIAPDIEQVFGNGPNKGSASGEDRFRFTWPWRRKP